MFWRTRMSVPKEYAAYLTDNRLPIFGERKAVQITEDAVFAVKKIKEGFVVQESNVPLIIHYAKEGARL